MPPAHAGRLTIDLDALKANYRSLRERASPAATGAAVKADAYGLGLAPVVRALYSAGCDTFFVAHLSEAARLRDVLGPEDADVYVLNGLLPDTAAIYCDLSVRPVLGSVEEVEEWAAVAPQVSKPDAALHVDTGFTRLGLKVDDACALLGDSHRLAGVSVSLLMSHLACADTPEHPMNRDQLARFDTVRRIVPNVPASLANSGGIFLGAEYQFDMVRPGIALYGGRAVATGVNPMQAVASLEVPIVQVREASPGETVGYGATYRFDASKKVALISLGYADGFLRCLSGDDTTPGGRVFMEDIPCPVLGRISMDITAVDVTAVPDRLLGRGRSVEVIGPNQTVDDLARNADTIGYEILTGLGLRFSRVYSGA